MKQTEPYPVGTRVVLRTGETVRILSYGRKTAVCQYDMICPTEAHRVRVHKSSLADASLAG